MQNWFASSATQIALSGHYVDWYTPLGLYVRQPYCKKPVRHVIRTNLQWLLLQATGLPDIPPDTRKQRGAFPPNFIHSLDSTHMMLTAMYCQRSGSTFASVHDSFWTHAANVDVMNRVSSTGFTRELEHFLAVLCKTTGTLRKTRLRECHQTIHVCYNS